MNFGYVKDTAGITKPINIDDIKLVEVTLDTITIRYNLTSNFQGTITDQASFFISFNNPSGMPITTIEYKFYSWLKNVLVSPYPLKTTLNSALPQLEIVTAGLINTLGIRSATFETAPDEATACALTPTADCIIESKVGAPPVGTLVLAGSINPGNDFEPIADGTYALNTPDKYFVTLNGSRITSIVPCPLSLDFIWDPNQQASGVINDANYISFGSKQDLSTYYGFTNTSNSYYGDNTMLPCNTSLKSVNDATWPSGLIFNGDLQAADGLGQLPAFAASLVDSNVANWTNAQLYVSQDYYLDPNNATWSLYNQDFWAQGYQWFGNGTSQPNNFYDANSLVLFNMSSQGRVFLPSGQSLVGTANFGSVQFANFQSNGVINNPSNC